MQNYRHNQSTCMPYRPAPAASPVICKESCSNMVLAMAYTPWQTWRDIYDAEKGFHCGTIFQELNLPFYGKGGMKR